MPSTKAEVLSILEGVESMPTECRTNCFEVRYLIKRNQIIYAVIRCAYSHGTWSW